MLSCRCLVTMGRHMLHRVGRSALNTCWPTLTRQHGPECMLDGGRYRVIQMTCLMLCTAHQGHGNASAPVRRAVSDKSTGCGRAHVSALRRPLPEDPQLLINVQAAAAILCKMRGLSGACVGCADWLSILKGTERRNARKLPFAVLVDHLDVPPWHWPPPIEICRYSTLHFQAGTGTWSCWHHGGDSWCPPVMSCRASGAACTSGACGTIDGCACSGPICGAQKERQRRVGAALQTGTGKVQIAAATGAMQRGSSGRGSGLRR